VDAVPPIVDRSWFDEHRDIVMLCEVRTSMAGDDMDAPPAAGARLLTLENDLATPPAGGDGRHPLPSPESFAAALGAAGIDQDDTVVAFDAHHGAYAARLVWMLRIIGQPAALLDGGLDGGLDAALIHAPFDAGEVEPVARAAVPWPEAALADGHEVIAHIAAGGLVVDSRDAARYAGETEPIDRIAGHIPGAINIPFAGNLRDGRFLPPAELAARFASVAEDPLAIVHCGSGVTACHNALAMASAGLPLPRVYVGSWSGWISDPDHPIATGPQP
jgi:thiosulfate/3-mercaptopyruvate sulfurtransferase